MKSVNIAFIFIVFWCACFSSCNSYKMKKEAVYLTDQFFNALSKGDEKQLQNIYPDFRQFYSFYKSTSYKVSSKYYKNDTVYIIVENEFINGFGQKHHSAITLIFANGFDGNLAIQDSKGLCSFEEDDIFVFGLKTGCISTLDTTDLQRLKGVERSRELISRKAIDLHFELKEKITVSKWEWTSGYGGYATASGIVTNSTDYSIPRLEYQIDYKDSNGDLITSDNGMVSYDEIPPNSKRSFTQYTNYIGNASAATIKLNFNTEFLYKLLAQKSWSGKECENFY